MGYFPVIRLPDRNVLDPRPLRVRGFSAVPTRNRRFAARNILILRRSPFTNVRSASDSDRVAGASGGIGDRRAVVPRADVRDAEGGGARDWPCSRRPWSW